MSIARTLVHDPEVLVLDEPTTGLDLVARQHFLETVSRVAREGTTVILVTHHIEELPAAVSHALLLRDGRIVASGPIAEALDGDTLSECYGLPLRLERVDGRMFVTAVKPSA